MYSQQSLNIYACMWIEWTISIRWVGLLICARVGLFWVGNINGTKFPDTARLQPIPPPWYRRKKKKKVPDKAQEWLHDGWTSGWLVGRGRCSLHKNASFGQNSFVHTALLQKQQILKGWNSKLRWLVWDAASLTFFKTLQALGVPRSKRNSIRGIRNPKLGRALKIPHWAQICHGFPSGCPDVLPRIGMIWLKASVLKRH